MALRPGPSGKGPPQPIFLDREVYRRNRIADAARLLPLLGAVLLLFPDLILSDQAAAEGATAPWLVYFFAAWLFLIGLAFILSRKLNASGTLSRTQGGVPQTPPPD